jgi:pimeloyl-ACP methyl ester carboxylesterase
MAGTSGALIRNNSHYNIAAHEERSKQANIACYADDLVEIGTALGLKDAVFVGHSVSAMIRLLA